MRLVAGGFVLLLAFPSVQASGSASVALDNALVHATRVTDGTPTGIDHRPGVVVQITDSAGATPGEAHWVDDPATVTAHGTVVIVQPKDRTATTAAPPSGGSAPGDSPFTGMSFTPMFDNARVSVIRARMEVGAREAFHTHASDTIVVHLSGGAIEDTSAGKTVVNRWKPGDVEFESRGSSHSARNVGGAVDVVLVALKP